MRADRSPRRIVGLAAIVALLAGAALIGEQLWLGAKARLAGRLIDDAFARYLEDGRAHRPWRWADTHPIARLEFPGLDVSRTVLAGASGASLAFGPGHIDGTAAPGDPGNSVIAGHRDSWFAFLADVRTGDEMRVRTAGGVRRYRVAHMEVRADDDPSVLEPTADARITLVTCYPLDAVTPGPERWVVTLLPDL